MTEKKLVKITPERKENIDYIIDEFHVDLNDWMVLNNASIITYISDELCEKIKNAAFCTIELLEVKSC